VSRVDDINWKYTSTPNKGGRPQGKVSFDGQLTHRTRRGKVVEIPEEWRGQVTRPQTIRKRQSKMTRKLRNQLKWRPGCSNKRDLIEARAPKINEWE
jgi:hypothetical protein